MSSDSDPRRDSRDDFLPSVGDSGGPVVVPEEEEDEWPAWQGEAGENRGVAPVRGGATGDTTGARASFFSSRNPLQRAAASFRGGLAMNTRGDEGGTTSRPVPGTFLAGRLAQSMREFRSTGAGGENTDGSLHQAASSLADTFARSMKEFRSAATTIDLKGIQKARGDTESAGGEGAGGGSSLPRPAMALAGSFAKSLEEFRSTAATVDLNEQKKKFEAQRKPPTPEAILSSPGCKARVLTSSDQHATILLTHKMTSTGGQEEEPSASAESGASEPKAETSESLLKLTVVPFHKGILGRKVSAEEVVNAVASKTMSQEDQLASKEVLSFLSSYQFNQTSESGAEYSYYDASPIAGAQTNNNGNVGEVGLVGSLNKALFEMSVGVGGIDAKNGVDDTVTGISGNEVVFGKFTAELISPASDRQIQRALPTPATAMVEETPALYKAVTQPFIEEIVAGKSLDWITNIVEGKKEKERLLLDHEKYILNVDTKWRSHPDPNTTPREQWLNHESTEDLYCLGIIKGKGIASLRDLRGDHIPILRSMITEGTSTILKVYGIPMDQIRVFVHYQPQFYHFHVHYTRLHNEIGCQVERGHLVSDIIQNLEMDPDYYTKRTVTFRLRETDKLFKRIKKHYLTANAEPC